MKDIDFDELDKAVSSVLSREYAPPATPTPEELTASNDSLTKTETTSSDRPTVISDKPPAAAEATTVKTVVHETSPGGPLIARSLPPAAPLRRPGRFMDMVHPSSDMAAGKPVVEPTKRVSMAGRTLQPLAPQEPVADNATAVDEDLIQPHTPSSDSGQTATTVEEEIRWPDPIDIEALAAEAPVEANPEAITAPYAATPSAPVPFVSDAKVEKRPLGAFSEATPAEQSEETAAVTHTVPSRTADQLPPELAGEIVSVESNVVKLDDEQTPQAEASTPASPALISGTLSIPKQYQEAEQPADTPAHPLYDTTQYHPPLSVVPEHSRRSLWTWLIIAVLLLLVTAGLFAYWYIQGI